MTTEEPAGLPDVFEFEDYREYLKAYYASARAAVPGFSFRSFSKKAGYTSPNFLKLVMDGDRNLGEESVARFASAFGLTGARRRYFERIVAFCQATDTEERNDAFARLRATQAYKRARPIESDLFDYLSNWYGPAIREMTARLDFQEDPAWVAAELLPPIKPDEAAKTLDTLERLGLVERDGDGRLRRGEPTLTTGPEVTGLAVRNFHSQMLERAEQSLDLVHKDLRDVGTVTVAVSHKTAVELKARVQDFRSSVLRLCDAEEAPEVVYQLNLQLFPLSGSGKPSGGGAST